MDNRISNRDGASPGAAADSTRRADKRVEEEGRDRAARFKRTLGQEREQAADQARALAGRAGDQEARTSTRQRDLTAAAEVLGRLGIEDGAKAKSETKFETKSAAAGEAGAANPGEQSAELAHATGSAGAGEVAGGKQPDLREEIAVIEKAAEKVLESRETSKAAAADAPLEEALPHMAPWARPEGPTHAPPPPREMPSPPPGSELYHRLLMGQGPLGPEARLAITQGPLAGLQIHLTQGPQGLKAAVLTQGASSRQTLTSAMEEVARRLRDKGHHLDVKWGAGTGASSLPGGGGGSTSSRSG